MLHLCHKFLKLNYDIIEKDSTKYRSISSVASQIV